MANNENLTPLEKSRKREKELIQGLHDLARQHGKEIFPIHGIDANGEITFAIKHPDDTKSRDNICGQFGEEIASYLNQIKTRTGIMMKKGYILPENGWVKISHVDAEKLLDVVKNNNDIEFGLDEDNGPPSPK